MDASNRVGVSYVDVDEASEGRAPKRAMRSAFAASIGMLALILAVVAREAPAPAGGVFTVTNLADNTSGSTTAGSLRDGIAAANINACLAPCTIQFSVNGTITLFSPLTVSNASGLTIDGFTSPTSVPNSAGFGSPLNNTIPIGITTTSGVSTGLSITSSNVTVQGMFATGFSTAAISLGSTGGLVKGCYIGTANGTAAFANGTGITVSNSSNVIGGTSPADANLISGNSNNGISITAGTGNLLAWNYIGTQKDATSALANGTNGISISGTATGSDVGNTTVGNIISGNTQYGVSITSGSNTLAGNRIGTSGPGTAARANGSGGVLIQSGSNQIGGTGGASNVISGNTNYGILLTTAGATSNVIQSNLIGTNITGNAAVANTLNGILLQTTANSNTIGGIGAGEGNLISGNGAEGLRIQSTGNTVQGNTIGANFSGTSAIANNGFGISVEAATNTIGGATSAERNVISGNVSGGIDLFAGGNFVLGNYIGTNASGNGALGVFFVPGVLVESAAAGNQIGGTSAGEGNVISGNGNGILVNGSSTTIFGNFIGTDATGSGPVANQNNGILCTSTSNTTTIGGSGSGRNVISGNGATSGDGIRLQTAFGVSIKNNYIGTNAAGTLALSNNGRGIYALTTNNVNMGGVVGEGNLVSGNANAGIYLDGGTGASIKNNIIGRNASNSAGIANGTYGVFAINGATSAAIDLNTIANNTGKGFAAQSTTTKGINLLGNTIFSNAAPQIDLNDDGTDTNDATDSDTNLPNNKQNYPVIDSAYLSGGTLNVAVTVDSSGAAGTTNLVIEVFKSNVSGHAGAFLGSACFNANSLASQNISIPSAPVVSGDYLVTTATNRGGTGCVSPSVNDGTSELSATAVVTIPGVVTNTNDSGTGSLRQAITDANTNVCASPCTITFNIPNTDPNFSGGVYTIKPLSALPDISKSNTTLDGTTQTTFGGDTNVNGPEIMINGALAGAGTDGLRVSASVTGQGSNITIKSVIVNAFNGDGIELDGSGLPLTNPAVSGNFIGTDQSGTVAIANGTGVYVHDQITNASVGSVGFGNLISGNSGNGVLFAFGAGPATVKGNKIGPSRTGTALANGGAGILISGSSNIVVGGTTAGEPNTIAFNTGAGVAVTSTSALNSIRGNSIHSNGFLGIDLSGDLVTANDSGDGDSGPNALQNYPVLLLATYNSGSNQTTFSGTLNSVANTTFDIDWYSNPIGADGTGYGEGQTWLNTSTFTTDALGNTPVSIVLTGNLRFQNVVATASRVSGGDRETSEFSAQATNNPPVANNDAVPTNEDTPVTFDPRVNDTDPENGALAITANTQPAPSAGTVTCGATSCTFTPVANYNGPASFTYTIQDDGGNTSTATVNITVNAVNDPPVANPDALTTNEDTANSVNVLTNDTDVDGPSALTVTSTTIFATPKGIVQCAPTGVCTYTPNPNQNGSDSFSYTVSDGLASSTGTVNVTITPINDPPVANPDTLVTNQNTAATVNVLTNDSDVDGPSALTVTGSTNGTKGTVSCSPTGACTYTPNLNQTGADSFTYTVSDGASVSTGTVNVTINSTNAPPNAAPDFAETTQGNPVSINVLFNDSDPNGDPLTVISNTTPSNGSATCSPGGICTYTPNAGFTGVDSFSYTIKDPQNAQSTATVTINVKPCPTAPNTFTPSNGATGVATTGKLFWNNTAAQSYSIYLGRADKNGCNQPFASTDNTFIDYANLEGNTTYAWRVEGITSGCPIVSGPCNTFTTKATCPTTVTLVKPVSGTATSPIEFEWNAVAGATEYTVFAKSGNGNFVEVGKTSSTKLTASIVADGSVQWFVVANVTGCGNVQSAIATFNLCNRPSIPVARVIGEATSAKTYRVEWDDVPNAIRYEVDEATNANFTGATTTSTTSNFAAFKHDATDTPLAFFYRVRAFSACSAQPSENSLTLRIVIIPLPKPTEQNPNTNIPAGSTELVVQQVFIPGVPGVTAFFNAVTDRPWLSVRPPNGTLPPEGVTLEVIADPATLPNGTFTATVIVTITTPGASAANGVSSNGTTTTSKPVSISLVTPVTPVQNKLTPNGDSLIIPSVGHLDGVNSHWQSDIRVTNIGTQLAKYALTFTPSTGTASGVKQTTISVGAGETTALDDIIKNWYGIGSLGDSANGTLEIRSADSTPLTAVASSRTYDVTSNGTLGQYIPALPFGGFIGKAAQNALATTLSMQQISQSSLYRTNVGVVEASGNPASVLMSVFNATGSKLIDIPLDLKAGEQKQLNSVLAANNITLADGRVEVKVTGGDGKVTAYASVVDNNTQDPLLVSGVRTDVAGASKYVLPGVADITNALANWRTDMRIFNTSLASQSANLTLYTQGGGTPLTANVTLQPGEVRALDDVVKSLFKASNVGGAVHVETNSQANLIVTGRTYNLTSEGTFGQFIEAVTPAQAVAANGKTLHVLQVEDSTRFRTNLGIAEVSGQPVTVEVSVVLPDSKVTPTITFPMAANEFRQMSVIRDLNLGNVYNARLTVRVVSGQGRVAAYGSVVDMTTQDPTYVPASQ